MSWSRPIREQYLEVGVGETNGGHGFRLRRFSLESIQLVDFWLEADLFDVLQIFLRLQRPVLP